MSKSYEKPILNDVSPYGGAAEPYGIPVVVGATFAAVLAVYVVVGDVVVFLAGAANVFGIVHVSVAQIKTSLKES